MLNNQKTTKYNIVNRRINRLYLYLKQEAIYKLTFSLF